MVVYGVMVCENQGGGGGGDACAMNMSCLGAVKLDYDNEKAIA